MISLQPQQRLRLAHFLGPLGAAMLPEAKVRHSPFWRQCETDHQRLARVLLQTGRDWGRPDNLFLRQAVNSPRLDAESRSRIEKLRARYVGGGAI